MQLKRYQVLLAFIAIIMAFGFVGQSDFDDEQAQADHYCDMVKLYTQTNGQQGWPAYQGACK